MSGTEERIAALRFSTHSLNPRKLDDEMPRRSTVSNRYKPMHACDRKKLTLAFSSTHLLSCVLWLNDTSYSKSVWRRNRNVPAKNTLVQLLALYTNCESQNAQRHRQTDRRTDRRQDYANSRSYCVAVRSIGLGNVSKFSAASRGPPYDTTAFLLPYFLFDVTLCW